MFVDFQVVAEMLAASFNFDFSLHTTHSVAIVGISFCVIIRLKANRQAEKEHDHVRSIAADVLQLHPGRQPCQDCYCCSI